METINITDTLSIKDKNSNIQIEDKNSITDEAIFENAIPLVKDEVIEDNIITDEIKFSIERYEPRVELIEVEAFPNFDNNAFDVLIVYNIIGADVPPQELQFALQSTR